MKKVFIPLCILLVLCVALSGCATATGSSAASVPTATNSMQSVPSTGTSETISKQNSQTGSGSASVIDETPNGTYISDETTDRLFEDYALPFYKASLGAHTWNDPAQIDTESLIWFYLVNKAVDAYPLPTGDDVMIHVPAADLEGYIMSYFNVDPKYLETDQRYNTDTECYDLKYPDGLGMFYPEYVKAEKKDNIIDFYFENTDYKETMLVHNRLTIELKEDGGFRYIAGELYDPGIPVSDSETPMGNN